MDGPAQENEVSHLYISVDITEELSSAITWYIPVNVPKIHTTQNTSHEIYIQFMIHFLAMIISSFFFLCETLSIFLRGFSGKATLEYMGKIV